MAISPPSDIVLDVARAAEPQDIEAARAALTKRAGGAAAAFSVDAASAPRPAGDQATAPARNYQRFEAMVLQTFIQNMLPKDAEGVYGKGLAGDMWKSQLAEHLADVMADRGGIGIARSML
ncbi:MAG: rod-binding protein, partial [Mesorhizobium sp.]